MTYRRRDQFDSVLHPLLLTYEFPKDWNSVHQSSAERAQEIHRCVNRLFFISVSSQVILPENYNFSLCQFGGSLRMHMENMFEADFERSRPMRAGEFDDRSFWFRLAVRLSSLTAPIR